MLCRYLGCKRDGAGTPGVDTGLIGLPSLAQAEVCGEHRDLLRRRVAKAARRAETEKFVQERAAAKKSEIDWEAVRASVKRIEYFESRLAGSSQQEAAQAALKKIREALTSGSSGQHLKWLWAGLVAGLKESRRRRWNARRAAEWLEVVAFYGGMCAYCEESPWGHVDHVVPLAKGGNDDIGNAVPACPKCNWGKGAQTGWSPRRRHRLLAPAAQTVAA